jgi:hypothetical protein
MDTDGLKQFDLHFPSPWIENEDRDWAFENYIVLKNILLPAA